MDQWGQQMHNQMRHSEQKPHYSEQQMRPSQLYPQMPQQQEMYNHSPPMPPGLNMPRQSNIPRQSSINPAHRVNKSQPQQVGAYSMKIEQVWNQKCGDIDCNKDKCGCCAGGGDWEEKYGYENNQRAYKICAVIWGIITLGFLIMLIMWPHKLVFQPLRDTMTLNIDRTDDGLRISGDIDVLITNPNPNDVIMYDLQVDIEYDNFPLAVPKFPSPMSLGGNGQITIKVTVDESFTTAEAVLLIGTGLADCFDNSADFLLGGSVDFEYGIFPLISYAKRDFKVSVPCV